MSSFHVPENQTVSYSVYVQAVWNELTRNDCITTYDEFRKLRPQLVRAFDHGEPVWMIAAELKLIHEARQARPIYPKSPLQLAKRVVRFQPAAD